MSRAESLRHEDNDAVRITEWRFAPGAATGHHRHAFDYVVVYVTAAKIRAVGPTGETSFEMAAGQSYFRKAGVEHDVINVGDAPAAFVEIEIKRSG
ncbi:MAG TPA: cupin domain-containing protein [Stellaceae bacterium]|nr:cupin domain-containing protein [Stellaceae bacterium]